jgi:hypothetical protein
MKETIRLFARGEQVRQKYGGLSMEMPMVRFSGALIPDQEIDKEES